MKKMIDCLIIGYNEVDFTRYVSDIGAMGAQTGAFRDLNLSFVRYKGQPYHAAGIYNLVCSRHETGGPLSRPMSSGETFSAAIAYLGTYLHRRGFSFAYVNSFRENKDELLELLKQENILTIAITTTFYVSAYPLVEIVNFIKQNNKTAKIIIGGPFVSTNVRVHYAGTLDFLFRSLGADFYVNSSQGEAALVNLIKTLKNNLPIDRVNNIYYQSSDGYRATKILPEDNPLSENMVDWKLFPGKELAYLNLRTSISCPFSCAFCGFPQHAGKYRTAEIAAVAEELNSLAGRAPVLSVNFIDDTINVPAKRFKELLRLLTGNKYPFNWYSQVRCQFLDRETVALMKESKCEGVFLGLESGSNRILDNMNKKSRIEDYISGIALLKEYGLPAYGSFIVGFPGETEDTVKETVNLIEQTGLDFFRTQLWYCEPITPIWQEREKYGISGSNFEWAHRTMDANRACDLIDDICLSVKNSLWLPQYGFDFNNIFHLLHRGIDLDQVKRFIAVFNSCIKEKLNSPAGDKSEISENRLKELSEIVFPSGMNEPIHLDPGDMLGDEDLLVDFDLDP